ncbi:hypothetical protein BDM02DRAFT_3190069 [Thelephora ganbajun]|uniref:Uncharacterized protein n=1 Tax=Thelephora ganbajun TaxID=370292 RepID=A0ACB6Z6R0_THEGA|nr:hypothetical protein BDM02DRAFT_3190069 [Thelephora ganbajun]
MNDKNAEIRIAVALVALRFKPIRQSCVAYVLDLRDRFPCPGGGTQSAENMLVGREWKERALELETRCSRLEGMVEWDKLEHLMGANTTGHATIDQGKKRDKARNRLKASLERVLNGKMAGHSLDGLITISARSALTIYERLMRAQDGLLTRPSDSVTEREELLLTVIPVTFAVARSGLEELGKMVEVMMDVSRNPRETCDVLGAIDWMLCGMLQSLFTVATRSVKVIGLRPKQTEELERLVEEECDRTFGTLTEMILVRLVRLIFPWMERMLEGPEQTTDIPMELIGILEGALDTVEQFGFDGGAASARERVGLGVCQELKRLSRKIPVDSSSKSVQERKQRLAKKEAVWYLGAFLQKSCRTSEAEQGGK